MSIFSGWFSSPNDEHYRYMLELEQAQARQTLFQTKKTFLSILHLPLQDVTTLAVMLDHTYNIHQCMKTLEISEYPLTKDYSFYIKNGSLFIKDN